MEKVFGECESVKTVLIVVCSRCGRLLLAKAEEKTRTCPYCGFKVALDRAKKIGSAGNAQEASKLLRKLKDDAAQRRKR